MLALLMLMSMHDGHPERRLRPFSGCELWTRDEKRYNGGGRQQQPGVDFVSRWGRSTQVISRSSSRE
jgi:hypothetical protein